MLILGVDPGTSNLAVFGFNSICSKEQGIFNSFSIDKNSFYKSINNILEAIYKDFYFHDYEKILIVIERQFDRSKEKKLEQVVAIIKFWFKTIDQKIDILMVAPTQLKKFVTGKGNADEAMMWMGIEKKMNSGEFCRPKTDNQHIIEAMVMAEFGFAFDAITNNNEHDKYPKYVVDMISKSKVE